MFLHCILFSCYFLFWYFVFLSLFNLANYQKHLSKIWNCKKNKYEKKTNIFRRAVSTGVLTNSVIFSFFVFLSILHALLKTLCKSGFQPKKQKICCVKNWSKVVFLKIGPSMLRSKIGQVFNTTFCFFLKISSFCRENEIFKNKITKSWTIFNTKRANLGPF